MMFYSFCPADHSQDTSSSEDDIFYGSKQQPKTLFWQNGEIPYVFNESFGKEHAKSCTAHTVEYSYELMHYCIEQYNAYTW